MADPTPDETDDVEPLDPDDESGDDDGIDPEAIEAYEALAYAAESSLIPPAEEAAP